MQLYTWMFMCIKSEIGGSQSNVYWEWVKSDFLSTDGYCVEVWMPVLGKKLEPSQKKSTIKMF